MVENLFKNGVFVIHALTGYDYHKKRIESIFPEFGMQPRFITDGDPSRFNAEILKKYFNLDIESVLSKGVLSCTLNHIFTLEKIVEEKLPYALIFENDPFFLGDFNKKFRKLIPEIESLGKGFMISLENSTLRMPSYWDSMSGKKLHQAKTCRMSGSYLIDLECAKNILEDLKTTKCHTVIDWWHDSLIKREVIKIYWAHPYLVEEGSHNGHLNATISTKKSSTYRKLAWKAQKYFKTYVMRVLPSKYILQT